MKFKFKLLERRLTAFLLILVGVFFSAQSPQVVTQVFTDPTRPATFVVPSNVTSLYIRVWGAGGAGGGGGAGDPARGGGGGGAYSEVASLSVSAGQVYTVIVGAGGNGRGNPGGAGGTSLVQNSSTIQVSAFGGSGGGADAGAGGSGGIGFKYSGGNGASPSNNSGGGGGGSAGSGGAGGSASGTTAGTAGAGSPSGAAGGAGAAANCFLLCSGKSGSNGLAPGAGGGGRSTGNFSEWFSNIVGGNGADGRIEITYTTNSTNLGITKTVDNSNAAVGQPVTFTITVKNNSSANANDVYIEDQLPDGYTFIGADQQDYQQSTGQWKIGTMAPGASATLKITAIVNETGSVYNNIATVKSTSMVNQNPAGSSANVTVTACKATAIAPQVKQK